VPSRLIGESVMQELGSLDHVAYVRFASVYRSFEDVNEFREVIDRLEKQPSPDEAKEQQDMFDA
jgi:transcriptional repressor NrdR